MAYFDVMHLVTYSDVYGKEANSCNIEELVSTIPSISALEWLSYIYYRKTQLKDGEDEIEIVMPLMFKFDNETSKIIINYLNRIANIPYRFIDGKAIMILMDKILANNNKQTDKLSKTQASNLLKAYLICCNIRLSDITKGDIQAIDNVDDNIKTFLPEQLKINELEQFKGYRLELIKFYEFMCFCESNDKFKQYVDLFLSTRHCQNWSKYLLDIFYIFTSAALETPNPTNKFNPPNQSIKILLDLISINDVEYSTNQDFNLIRTYPILKIDDNTYSVLNMNFFLDKMFQGLLFDLASVLESNDMGDFFSLKSNIGENFTEHHLFYSVMTDCFHKQFQVLLSGKEIKSVIGDGEPDFYLRKGNRIFLFEFKDVTIKAEIKNSGDFERIKTELFEQVVCSEYSCGKKRKNPKPKGVTQIFNCINEKLVEIIKKCDNMENTTQLQIFPILVYQDPTFDVEGVNYLLNQEFKKMVDSMENPRNLLIKDLVIIPLNLFYELEDYFADGKIKLVSSINEYINQKHIGQKYEIRPFCKYLLEKANKKGFHNEKTKRFQKCIDNLKKK